MSWIELEDDGVALDSANCLWNEAEPRLSDLYSVHGGQSKCHETREDEAVHLD